ELLLPLLRSGADVASLGSVKGTAGVTVVEGAGGSAGAVIAAAGAVLPCASTTAFDLSSAAADAVAAKPYPIALQTAKSSTCDSRTMVSKRPPRGCLGRCMSSSIE